MRARFPAWRSSPGSTLPQRRRGPLAPLTSRSLGAPGEGAACLQPGAGAGRGPCADPPPPRSRRNFMRDAEEIACSRRMNSLTLNRHTEILEILEIPQLMDTCVRNGYYEEALELAAYVHRLERKHSAIPVIQGIVDEVRQSTQLMLNQLIQQLRTNIQLPACLRVIGYLRRMDVFTEAELRIKFLQARDAWLRSIQASIPDDDPYFHITKTIEACRVHLFDIITQYRAIFSDEEPLLPPDEQALNEGAIFHGWVLQKVSEFLQVLEGDLQRGVGGRLDSLLGQCMYFGLSFSRVGADFRGQLAPIFQRITLSAFRKAVEEAVEKFQEEMNSYTLISAPAALGSAVAAAVPTAQPGTLQPPMVLLDFPPLACFLNNLLVAFNDLRLCCPVALAQDVTSCLEDALGQVRLPGQGCASLCGAFAFAVAERSRRKFPRGLSGLSGCLRHRGAEAAVCSETRGALRASDSVLCGLGMGLRN
uniref:Conserved oligomeric Golgi complex subunit 8 n=1 Tax=Apteryx owenii TaxID=8824 RepID=A0A8B9NUZ7_APTOW